MRCLALCFAGVFLVVSAAWKMPLGTANASPREAAAGARPEKVDPAVWEQAQVQPSINVLVQVEASYPHRRFDEEYVRRQRTDIRDLTLQIDQMRENGSAAEEVQVLIEKRDRLIQDVETEKLSLLRDIHLYNEASFAPNLDQVEALLAAHGVTSVRGLNGVYRVQLPVNLLALLGSHPGVARVASGARKPIELHVQHSVPTVGAPRFWNGGYTGTGIKVDILDNGIAATDYLNVVAAKACQDIHREVDHGTGVAAVINQNRTGEPTGVAYGASLYDATMTNGIVGWERPVADECLTWLATNGVHVANSSIGVLPGNGNTEPELLYDFYSDRYGMLHVVSIGNVFGGNTATRSPGTAYSVLDVSASYDQDDANRANDVFAADVSVTGPSLDGRKKPDLSAPGKGITTLAAANLNGTSYSAPHVSGVAAVVMQRLRALGVMDNLQVRARALLINSAESKRSTKDPTFGWWHPEWGWGYLDGDRAYQDAGSAVPKTHVGSVTRGGVVSLYFSATAGSSESATLVWKRKMADTGLAGWLSNLDLKVYDPNGNLIDASISAVDSVEYVRFHAPVTGTYRVDVIGTALEMTDHQFFAVAASQPVRSTP